MSESHAAAAIQSLAAYLRGMKHVLTQAQAHLTAKEVDEAALLELRMIADMAPLKFQVQVASELAARGAARLAGAQIPDYPRGEATVADLLATLDTALAAINSHSPEAIEAGLQREQEVPLGPAPIAMPGLTYLYQFLLPNVFFHATATYAIARENGVPLGKRDFMAGVDFMPSP